MRGELVLLTESVEEGFAALQEEVKGLRAENAALRGVLERVAAALEKSVGGAGGGEEGGGDGGGEDGGDPVWE